jgi:hypothetical protein
MSQKNNEPSTGSEPKQEPLPPEESSSTDRTPAASLNVKKPGFFRRTADRVTGPNTRFGKALVPAVRIFALMALCFLLGMLLVALQWYRPTLAQLNAARVELQNQSTSLQQSQQKLQAAEVNAFNAQDTSEKTQTQLGTDQARFQLMQVKLDLADVRVALAQNKTADGKTALAKAQADIKGFLAQYQKVDEKQVSNINAVFTLLQNDLETPNMAQQDIDLMVSRLNSIDQQLQSTPPDFWTCSCTAK